MAKAPLIKVREISYAYRQGNTVLKNVSLDVFPGEMVAVIGPSGVGKSTLLRCIRGLIKPAYGSITYSSNRVYQRIPSAKLDPRIAMVFQSHNLIMNQTALWNTLVGRLSFTRAWRSYTGMFSREDRNRCLECLASVGLSNFAERQVRHLSGGQLQRVGIARALVQAPSLLLADELTANLDVRTAEDLMRLLTALGRQNDLAVLMAAHNIELARVCCDRAIGMSGGHVVFDGPMSQFNSDVVETVFYGHDTGQEPNR